VKKMFIASALMLALCSSSYAWQPVGTDSSDSGYQGSSGARYQYDMGNAADRVRYGADPVAQLRDQIAVDPGRNVDRSTGQYGGGYLGR
jgi:hypothetical protein